MNERRKFIKKTALAASAAIVGINTGFTKNIIDPMTTKAIKHIEPLGFQWKARDPFLFCVHHEDYFPKGNSRMGIDTDALKGRNLGQDFVIKNGFRMYHGQSVPGFPYHPHRGFETITVVRTGMVDHSDSMGAAGRYGDGDTQWMTAGKGVQHAEMFPLINQEKENPLELFQIWLNLPRAGKFSDPHFKMLWSENIPKHESVDKHGRKTTIEITAGSIDDSKPPSPPPNSWAKPKENEVAVWNIYMEANAEWTLPEASAGINRTLYFYGGKELKANDRSIAYYHSAELDPAQKITLRNGPEEGRILILQGKPIGEPVVQHGPFVMNSKEEINQAFEDYQKTQFGGWPWPTNDPVHNRSKGRFAMHADGTVESK